MRLVYENDNRVPVLQMTAIDEFIAEQSTDNDSTYLVRALHFTAYQNGIYDWPSTFICECDSLQVAEMIATLLNNGEIGFQRPIKLSGQFRGEG